MFSTESFFNSLKNSLLKQGLHTHLFSGSEISLTKRFISGAVFNILPLSLSVSQQALNFIHKIINTFFILPHPKLP